MRWGDSLEAINLVELIVSLCGPEVVSGLSRTRGGKICDPRPGHEERHPSFSVYRKEQRWAWKRHGGDGAGGNAFDLLLHFGYSETQAWEEVRRLAGAPQDSWTPRRQRRVATSPDPLREARAKLARCAPLDEKEQQRAQGLLAPLRPGDLASLDLQSRGLLGWAGLVAHKLRRDYWGRDGRLAYAGSLAFFVRGPDGQPWGLKARNHIAADTLRAAGMDRYVYRLKGHGTPAWCSPAYGSGDSVLIIEGELNGAAAACALEAAGVHLDVQGLAGASGTPFLDGLAGQRVYLYADPDEAGRACLNRVGTLAQAAGAREVRLLASLPTGDFCDLAGESGVKTLGARVLTLLAEADSLQSRICGSSTLPESFRALGEAQRNSWQAGKKGWALTERC